MTLRVDAILLKLFWIQITNEKLVTVPQGKEYSSLVIFSLDDSPLKFLVCIYLENKHE